MANSMIASVEGTRLPDAGQAVLDKHMKRPGPVPRSVRYAKARRQHEGRVAQALPEIFDALLAAVKSGDSRAGIWLMESLIGKPAPAQVAPVDDNSLPVHSLDRQTVEQMTIAQLSDQALLQVKAIMLRDLQARGIIKPDASASIELTGAPPPPEGSVPQCGFHHWSPIE